MPQGVLVQVQSRVPNKIVDRLVYYFIFTLIYLLIPLIVAVLVAMNKNVSMEHLLTTPKSEVFSPDYRFKQIALLRRDLGLKDGNLSTYGESLPLQPDDTTIGIEIEMSWMQAFPDLAKDWQDSEIRPGQFDRRSPEFKQFNASYNSHDKALRPILETIQDVIPKVGYDAYWEFSFLPSKHIGVTLAELKTLYDAHVLRDGEAYATHMTVAGIDNDRDAFAFLCGLELSGGSNPARIKTAIESKKGSWARKGTGGLLQRRPDELMGDDTTGYEFRTLVARSSQQMESLLLTAQQLGSLVAHDPDGWRTYRSYIEDRLKSEGLALAAWQRPTLDSASWLKYANLLSSAQTMGQPGSPAASSR